MVKKKMVLCCALTMMMSLSACAEKEENYVNVFRADQLMNAGQIANRYVGMVVSENTIKVQKDYSKGINELLVEEGQKVSKGDTLFIYDTNDLDIQLDRAQLELDKSYALRNEYENNLAAYEEELKNTTDEATISQIKNNIDRAKNDIVGIDYTIEGQNRDYNRILEEMNNTKVAAPASGTIKKIDESGQSGAFITIQQEGAYKVKAVINEMNMNSGIMEGVRVKAISRTDANKVWFGEVKTLDLQGNSNSDNGMFGGYTDPMSQSTSYNFYVELDNTDGLLLGQHVYVELVNGDEKAGLWVPNYFVMSDETNKTEVWVANGSDKLEKRTITVGESDKNNGTIQIISGLANDEYIADPRSDLSNGMKVEYHSAADFEIEENIKVQVENEITPENEEVEGSEGE